VRLRSFAPLIVVLAALLTVAPDLAAGGAVVDPRDLPEDARSALMADIAAARMTSPDAFDRIAALRADLPELFARSRGGVPPLTRILHAQGPEALCPMLEQLIVSAEPGSDLDDRAWLAWQLALLDAVGMLRDRRAEPVLWQALAEEDLEPEVQRAAARAVAKLGTDAVAERLVALSRENGLRQRAVVAGMGHCRRLAVAQRLAELLAAAPDAAAADAAARSLGDVGSLWAWRTPSVATYAAEQEAVQLSAARALVAALVASDGEVRATAAKALLVVGHPATPELLAAARSEADPVTRAVLDQVAVDFAASPIR